MKTFCTHKIVKGELYQAEVIHAENLQEAYKIANAKGIVVDGILQYECDEFETGRIYDNHEPGGSKK